MKLALTADWLYTFGGAEHVLSEFLQIWPDAPIFTTVSRKSTLGPLRDADIRVSHLQKYYKLMKRHEPLLPWMPNAMELHDLSAYDTILSSSHAVGKGIVPPSSARHICYCHTPMRYAWEMEKQYLEDFRIPNFLKKRVKRALMNLRRWDLTTAKRVDQFLANSKTTQERIERIYNREAIVVPPPVNDRYFQTTSAEKKDFYFAVGRLVPYKRFDILIETANREKFPLVIAGTGQEEKKLKSLAGPTVTFAGAISDEELAKNYRDARAVLFSAFEDAGIVPVEAQASGTPVIAFKKGGAVEVIQEGITGMFFERQSVHSLAGAIKEFEKMSWDSELIRNHASQFSSEKFKATINGIVTAA